MKHVIEDFDQLPLLNVPLIIINQNGVREIVGLVTIHSGNTDQFPLDRLAEFPLAMERRVLKSNPAWSFVLNGPG